MREAVTLERNVHDLLGSLFLDLVLQHKRLPSYQECARTGARAEMEGVCLNSNFTSDIQEVDVEKKIPQMDDELKVFLESGLAALIFWRYILAPWVRDPDTSKIQRSPNDCRHAILNPSDKVKRARLFFCVEWQARLIQMVWGITYLHFLRICAVVLTQNDAR